VEFPNKSITFGFGSGHPEKLKSWWDCNGRPMLNYSTTRVNNEVSFSTSDGSFNKVSSSSKGQEAIAEITKFELMTMTQREERWKEMRLYPVWAFRFAVSIHVLASHHLYSLEGLF
jgi:hypothetical protein